MDREIMSSDSEDEAFQSADEGEMRVDNDDGPKGMTKSEEKVLKSEAVEIDYSESKQQENKIESENIGGCDLIQDNLQGEERENNETTEQVSGDLKNEDNYEVTETPVKSTKDLIKPGYETPISESLQSTLTDVVLEEGIETAQIDLQQAEGNKDSKNVLIDNKGESENHELLSSESQIVKALDRLAAKANQPTAVTDSAAESSSRSRSWGWGGWGSMISKATTSVSTMLESVETKLGIPNPADMAKIVTEEEQKDKKDEQPSTKKEEDTCETDEVFQDGDEKEVPKSEEVGELSRKEGKQNPSENGASGSTSGLGSWLSGLGVKKISTMVQNTSKDFVSGSLDALEFVGKKTIDVISKGDPGFRRRRTTLSQAIREAKERAQNKEKAPSGQDEPEVVTFSIEFDKFQGLAHLEALEMISHESEAEIEKILLVSSEEVRKDHEDLFMVIKEKFEESTSDDEDDDNKPEKLENFIDLMNENISNLSLSVSISKLIFSYDSTNAKSQNENAILGQSEQEKPDSGMKVNMEANEIADQEGNAEEPLNLKDLHSEAVTCFAEITARSVETFHKIGELMLLPDIKASFLVKTRAESLRKICQTLKAYITLLSSRYAAHLNERSSKNAEDKEVSNVITDVYLEASNSSTYIEDSYNLLLPIFQFTAIR